MSKRDEFLIETLNELDKVNAENAQLRAEISQLEAENTAFYSKFQEADERAQRLRLDNLDLQGCLVNVRGMLNHLTDTRIDKVIAKDTAIVVFWSDGTKTSVKCGPEDKFDYEKGLAIAILKHTCGPDAYKNMVRLIEQYPHEGLVTNPHKKVPKVNSAKPVTVKKTKSDTKSTKSASKTSKTTATKARTSTKKASK